MNIINKFNKFLLKKKMRSKGLRTSRNIFHQLILYLIYSRSKKLLLKNKNIKDIFAGKSCFILFTGNSVTDFDFDLLKNQPVIACGASVLHKDFKKCNTVAYLDPSKWEPRSLLHFDFLYGNIYKSTREGCKVILDTSAYPYLKELITYREQDTYFIASNGNYLSDNDIKSDLQKLNNIQESSIASALGVARYMGFNKIYFLGQDYLADPPVYGHFYDGYHEIGNNSDYEEYRERALMMITDVESQKLGSDKLPKFNVNRENGSLNINHKWKNKSCRVINVIKNDKCKSSIDSITFEDLKSLEHL